MSHDNMEGDIRKLLALLKKILKNHPQGSGELADLMDQKSFNLNLCFFTFLPMSQDDLDDIEDMYQELMNQPDESALKARNSKIEFKLSADDVDFLRKHGICF